MQSFPRIDALAIACLCALAGTAVADDSSGNASLLLGRKNLGRAWDADGIGRHDVYGLQLSFDRGQWPLHLALDLSRSEADAPGISGETTEVDVGVRRFWGRKLRPYLGGGLAFIRADVSVGRDDLGVGLWANAGLLWRVSRRWAVGLDLRSSRADARPVSSDVEVGGTQAAVSLGLAW